MNGGAIEIGETTIVLVRHGESVVTVDQVVGGPRSCTGLSPLGVRQAEALATRLGRTGALRNAAALVSSTLRRAVQTAEIIGAQVGSGALAIEQRDDLCELFPGDGDGLTWAEFTSRYGNPPWDTDPTVPMSPNGESLVAFRSRVGRALDAVAADFEGQTVVVACHGGVVVNSLVHFGILAPGLDAHPVIRVDNTSMTTWRRRRADGPWELVRCNDAAHLEALADDAS